MTRTIYLPLILFFALGACKPKEIEPTVIIEPDIRPEIHFLGKEDLENIPFVERLVVKKDLRYTNYTLDDTYPYKDTVRYFQWDKIKSALALCDSLQAMNHENWAVLQNRKDAKGIPPLPKGHSINKHKVETDRFGIERSQVIPLYLPGDIEVPDRYNYDGALVRINEEQENLLSVSTTNFEGDYLIPKKYLKHLENPIPFDRVIIVDRHNQNISTFEKMGGAWYVRSMNPCTTGANSNMYQRPTPLGLFVLQQKTKKMWYLKDGSDTELDGYAPWANRFCGGAWVHGVPVKLPATEIIEYSRTLGTVPLSHMCVRNVSSHAEYIHNEFPAWETLLFVIE